MITVTPKDIIESHAKFGDDILKYDLESVSDSTAAKKSNQTHDTTWIKILFKTVKGEWVPLRLSFSCVLTASKASLSAQTGTEKIKNMVLMFKKMSLEEIRSGDYVPREKSTEEGTQKDIAHMNSLTKMMYENTEQFTECLGYISDAYDTMCEKFKADYVENQDNFKFDPAKEKSWVVFDKRSGKIKDFNITIRTIRQTDRKNENGRGRIQLDIPLFRVKLPVNNAKLQLSWRNKRGGEETKPYVFDSRKTVIDKRNGTVKLHPAQIKNDGRLEDICVGNAGCFITYKSLVSGTIVFPKIVISKQGISLVNEVRELVVKRHKGRQQSETSVPMNTLTLMKSASDSEEDDPVVEKDNEAEESSEEEIDSENESVVNNDKPAKTNKKSKTEVKRKAKKSESSDSEDDIEL